MYRLNSFHPLTKGQSCIYIRRNSFRFADIPNYLAINTLTQAITTLISMMPTMQQDIQLHIEIHFIVSV